MKKDLTEEFLKKALEYINNAEVFASKEIPFYIQEVLEFSFYKELTNCLWGVSMIFLSLVIVYGVYIKKYKRVNRAGETYYYKFYESDSSFVGITATIIVPLFTVGFIICLNNGLDALQVKLAPRMYLIEYFKKTLKE